MYINALKDNNSKPELTSIVVSCRTLSYGAVSDASCFGLLKVERGFVLAQNGFGKS